MRGKVRGIRQDNHEYGITPAYAGKRKRKPNGMLQSKDHPRLCGEKLLLYVPLPAGIGSPPPMRGKVHRTKLTLAHRRITPAYAGKS